MTGDVFRQIVKGKGLRAQLARGAGVSLLTQFLGAILGFGLHFVLARTLTLEAYGIYTYAFSWATVSSFLARLGLTNSIVRFVAEYVDRQAWGLVRGLLSYANRLVVASSFFIALLISGALAYRGELEFVTFLTLPLIPIMALASIRDGVLRGLKHPGLSIAIDGVFRPVATLAVLGALFFFGVAASAQAAMIATTAGAIVALSVAGLSVRRYLPVDYFFAVPDRSESRKWFSVALSLLFMGGMSLIHTRADVIMLGLMRNPEEVALYGAASRYAVILLIPLQAVAGIAAPLVAESRSRGDIDRLRVAASSSGVLILALTLPAVVIYLAFGRWMLSLFGPEFEAAYPALVGLVLGQAATALCGSVSVLMTMTHHHKIAALINAGTAALNLALNGFLIPRFGITGAAIGTAAALVAQHVAMLFYVIRTIHVDPTFVSVVAHLMRKMRARCS